MGSGDEEGSDGLAGGGGVVNGVGVGEEEEVVPRFLGELVARPVLPEPPWGAGNPQDPEPAPAWAARSTAKSWVLSVDPSSRRTTSNSG